MNRKLILFVCLTLGVELGAQADDTKEKSLTEGSVEQRVDALASIQPGLGAVMHEFAYRFANTYWAANGGNWGLAQYQLKELLEAQEVAELTRPQRAPMLKANEQAYLKPLAKAIEKADLAQFNRDFAEAIKGCNGCHTALGYGFLHYRLPDKAPQEFLDFTVKTAPKYEEAKEPK
jgi:hypothetical protein